MAIERSDVCLILIDAMEGVTEQDAKIAGIAHERGKGVIIAVNKWDAIEKNDKTMNEFTRKIRNTLSFMAYAEIIFISALTGQRLGRLFDTIDMVRQNQNMRVSTGVLNEIMTEAVALQQPPSDKGKRLRLYYMTQVAVKPPTFVIFVNDKKLMHFSYTRYLENKIREAFGFRGTALKFIIRERSGKDTWGVWVWRDWSVWWSDIVLGCFRPGIFTARPTMLILRKREAAIPEARMYCGSWG